MLGNLINNHNLKKNIWKNKVIRDIHRSSKFIVQKHVRYYCQPRDEISRNKQIDDFLNFKDLKYDSNYPRPPENLSKLQKFLKFIEQDTSYRELPKDKTLTPEVKEMIRDFAVTFLEFIQLYRYIHNFPNEERISKMLKPYLRLLKPGEKVPTLYGLLDKYELRKSPLPSLTLDEIKEFFESHDELFGKYEQAFPGLNTPERFYQEMNIVLETIDLYRELFPNGAIMEQILPEKEKEYPGTHYLDYTISSVDALDNTRKKMLDPLISGLEKFYTNRPETPKELDERTKSLINEYINMCFVQGDWISAYAIDMGFPLDKARDYMEITRLSASTYRQLDIIRDMETIKTMFNTHAILKSHRDLNDRLEWYKANQENLLETIDKIRAMIGRDGETYLEHNEMVIQWHMKNKLSELQGFNPKMIQPFYLESDPQELDNPEERALLQLLNLLLKNGLDHIELAKLKEVRNFSDLYAWHAWKHLRMKWKMDQMKGMSPEEYLKEFEEEEKEEEEEGELEEGIEEEVEEEKEEEEEKPKEEEEEEEKGESEKKEEDAKSESDKKDEDGKGESERKNENEKGESDKKEEDAKGESEKKGSTEKSEDKGKEKGKAESGKKDKKGEEAEKPLTPQEKFVMAFEEMTNQAKRLQFKDQAAFKEAKETMVQLLKENPDLFQKDEVLKNITSEKRDKLSRVVGYLRKHKNLDNVDLEDVLKSSPADISEYDNIQSLITPTYEDLIDVLGLVSSGKIDSEEILNFIYNKIIRTNKFDLNKLPASVDPENINEVLSYFMGIVKPTDYDNAITEEFLNFVKENPGLSKEIKDDFPELSELLELCENILPMMEVSPSDVNLEFYNKILEILERRRDMKLAIDSSNKLRQELLESGNTDISIVGDPKSKLSKDELKAFEKYEKDIKELESSNSKSKFVENEEDYYSFLNPIIGDKYAEISKIPVDKERLSLDLYLDVRTYLHELILVKYLKLRKLGYSLGLFQLNPAIESYIYILKMMYSQQLDLQFWWKMPHQFKHRKVFDYLKTESIIKAQKIYRELMFEMNPYIWANDHYIPKDKTGEIFDNKTMLEIMLSKKSSNIDLPYNGNNGGRKSKAVEDVTFLPSVYDNIFYTTKSQTESERRFLLGLFFAIVALIVAYKSLKESSKSLIYSTYYQDPLIRISNLLPPVLFPFVNLIEDGLRILDYFVFIPIKNLFRLINMLFTDNVRPERTSYSDVIAEEKINFTEEERKLLEKLFEIREQFRKGAAFDEVTDEEDLEIFSKQKKAHEERVRESANEPEVDEHEMLKFLLKIRDPFSDHTAHRKFIKEGHWRKGLSAHLDLDEDMRKLFEGELKELSIEDLYELYKIINKYK